MDAGAQLQPERPHRLADVTCGPNCVGGLVEDGEEAVSGRVHQPPSVSLDGLARERVVALEQLGPRAIAE